MSDDTSGWKGVRRRRVLQGVGGAGLVWLAGCAGGEGPGGQETETTGAGTETETTGAGTETEEETAGGQAAQGGQLRLAQVKSPLEFDPVVLNDVPSAEVADQIFEGLYAYDSSTGHVPELATGEPEVSDGGQRWTVELVDGATFQNGDPVTASDVKYSFEAPVKEETENANEVNMIDSIETVDERTVQFDLKYPYGPFKHTLHLSVVPQSVREEDKQAFNKQNPVGSGAFQFVEWQEGSHVRLERWDDYWGDRQPNLERIEMVPVEEPTTRMTTLRNGTNDVIKEIPPKLWSTIEQMGNAGIQSVPGTGYFYLAFNCKNGPTTDPKVREAVDYCFSMDQAVSNFVEPTGLRQYSPLPASVAEDWGMPVEEWQQIPHDKDIERAQQLFDEAGVSNYNFRIIVPPDDKREQIGVTVANGLQEAGFKANVQRLDWGAFLEQYITGDPDDYNMYTLGWAGTPDPDAFTYYLFARTDDVLGVTNGCFYGANSQAGKEVSEKFVRARQSADRSERKQLYREGITTLLQDRAHIPAYNLKNTFGVRDYVQDFKAHPVDQFHLFSANTNTSIKQ